LRKLLYFLIFLITILGYLTIFNPKSIEISKIFLDTPNGYYLWYGHMDFNEIDVSCGFNIMCHKKFFFTKETNTSSMSITMLYRSFIPPNMLSISILDWSDEKLTFKDVKHTYLKGRVDMKINSCLISKDINIDGGVRFFIIKNNKNDLKGIDLIASDQVLGKKILAKICN
jgi:hypothetical protein